MKKILTMLFTLCAFCSAIEMAHADESLKKLLAKGEIRVANTQSSPPWSYLNAQNKPDGYDVAVAKEVMKRIGFKKIVFVADTFQNFIEGLKTDKYDVVMNDLTPTAQRAKQVDFSFPYGVEEFRIFIMDDNNSIHNRADLVDKKVGVTAGTTNESWSRAHLKKSKIVTYDNGGLVFNDLGNRRIDAVISSYFGGEKYRKANNLPIKAVGESLTFQLSAAAVKKGQTSLKLAINKVIKSMLKDGTLDKLSHKYIGSNYNMTADIKKAQNEGN